MPTFRAWLLTSEGESYIRLAAPDAWNAEKLARKLVKAARRDGFRWRFLRVEEEGRCLGDFSQCRVAVMSRE